MWRRLAEPEVRDRILRAISIGLILIAVGACVILVLAFVMNLGVLLVAFSGVLSMALAFYLFISLWPRDNEEPVSETAQAVLKAMEEVRKPEPLAPAEYRRQRERAQKMIREKAAPALAKAIRGVLRQDETTQMANRRRRRR